jgi:hypothetical protein
LYLGSFGRIIADEYCMCAHLLEQDQNVFAAAVSNIMPFSMLVQAIFSHWMLLNFGQSITSALAFVCFFWSTWFTAHRFLVFRSPQSGSSYFALSGTASFAVFVSILLSAGLELLNLFEAFTQQTFVSQTFFRYPGVLVAHAAQLALIGIVLWLASLKRQIVALSIALSALVGLLAGLSHYLSAALFAFLVVATYWKVVSNWRHKVPYNWEQVFRLGGTLAGLGLGLAISLFSDAAESRISQFELQSRSVSLEDRFVSVVLDPIWVLTSLATFSVALGLLVGFALERRFGLAAQLGLKTKSILKFLLLFLVFSLTVSLLASLVSYSAPWHGIAPRYLIAIFSVGVGMAITAQLSSRVAISRSASSLLGVLLVLGSYAGTWLWANELPKAWASGPLPIQTVKAGPGSGIVWQDTDGVANLECYWKIEPYLVEKKSYLID